MATPEVLQREHDLFLSPPLFDHPKGEKVKSRGLEIEKKIEFLESLTGKKRLEACLLHHPGVTIIKSLESSSSKKKGRVGADKMAVLTAWHRVDCRTRDALRRSFLSDLVYRYELCLDYGFAEECIRAFIKESGDGEVLVLHVQDPFHRLLLHGVCEFYNLVSVTAMQSKGTASSKMTRIKKKKAGSVELPNITLVRFLKMAKEGIW